MKINEKFDRMVKPAIDSMAGHEDEDSVVLQAGLERVVTYAQEKLDEVKQRNAARAAEMFAGDA